MTEKISGHGFRPVDTANARRTDTAKTAPPRSEAPGSGSVPPARSEDTVSLTHSAHLMSKLEEVVNQTPIVDPERVATLKNAIASGNYEIDEQRVADKILRLERELLG
jgi:negative regulator of flagellin synthesis FlgM